METLADLMGKNSSPRKKHICREIAAEAERVEEAAEECMVSMQTLVRDRQLTLNPINKEVVKVSKVMKFTGDSHPNFFTWKRDMLEAARELGIPLKRQGS